MNRLVARIAFVLAITVGTVGCGDGSTAPEAFSVSGAWARPTPGGATTGAMYLTVVADVDDAIISVSVPDDIAAEAEMHATVVASHDGSTHDGMTGDMHDGMTGEMMTMEALERVDLVAGEPFEFVPGETHIMLEGLVDPLELDQRFEIALELESGRSIPVDVVVADSAPTE